MNKFTGWNLLFTRNIVSKSSRNKSTKWIGSHKEPKTEEQRLRLRNKHKPFVLGRDNVVRDFTPIKIPESSLTSRSTEYEVKRTSNGLLPVYTEYKSGRSQILTLIRRVDGNAEKLCDDLGNFIPKEKIRIKYPTNHVEIKGNVQRTVRYWLTAVGY
jgi:hypothetical protein